MRGASSRRLTTYLSSSTTAMGNQACDMFRMNKRTCFVYLSTDLHVRQETLALFLFLKWGGGLKNIGCLLH